MPTGLQEVNLEDISIHFLCAYSTHPNWTQIVSTRNDYGQTLAHIAVTLGYFRLLQHLFKWQIDLNTVDSMGFSALHYAYLFKQEECANMLIHSGVDRFILDDLGRSPADLDPSLEVGLRPIMDMDSGADGAPPIECDTEMPDEVGGLYDKYFLIQQWMREGGDERRGQVSLSRCQSQEISSHPALDSADERVPGATYEHSSSLGIDTPEDHSTPAVAEGMDSEALIETGTPPNITHPPSPICEVSSHTQEANRPPDTGQNPISHPSPFGIFFESGHIHGPSVTSGTPESNFGPIEATETDPNLLYGQPGSGSHGESSLFDSFLPQDWQVVATSQDSTRSTLGRQNVEVESLLLALFPQGNAPFDSTSRGNDDVDPIASSHDNPNSLKTGGPTKPPINQPKRVFRRKGPRSPSGPVALTRPKRRRITKKGDTSAISQTPQSVDSPPIDGGDLDLPMSQPEVSGSLPQEIARRAKGNDGVPFSKLPPQVQRMMNRLAARIVESGLPQRNELEPRLGDAQATELMSFQPEALWLGYGEKGESILTLMVNMCEDEGFACMWCEHRPVVSKWKRTVAHIREHHFGFRPFPCDKVHDASWWVPIPLTSDFC